MEKPLISVVIPVYGVEKYLPDCFESVIRQTYENLEIIAVDDCSPDGCGAICEAYEKKDARIRAIHRTTNGGLSAARNTGIDAAGGEYLFFLDSDDWIAPDTIACLLEKMKAYHADCCAGACVIVLEKEDGSLVRQKRAHVPEHCDSAQKAMERLLLHESSACNRLYRREAFSKLRFPEGRINEDEPTVLRLYAQMERIVFLDKDTYFYRKRKNSITTSDFSMKKLDCVKNSRENLIFIRKNNPDLIPAAEYKYIKTMLWCYVSLYKLKTAEAGRAQEKLRHKIRKNRRRALRNPHLGIALKILALIL